MPSFFHTGEVRRFEKLKVEGADSNVQLLKSEIRSENQMASEFLKNPQLFHLKFPMEFWQDNLMAKLEAGV